MLFFALCLMILATAAARIPVKGVLEGICHMYANDVLSVKRLWSVVSVHSQKKYKEYSVICLYL